MTTEIYNVDNYTDAQLYDILDMNSPTDRELEAKILHLIRKYANMQTVAGNQLAKFFDDIYRRFFSAAEEEDQAITEGFESSPLQKGQDALQQQNITATQTFDYAQDKLQINPLIKQTITRVISIDSQYRDVTTSPFTTNFTFDLSEPLRDVVMLKLYSVQIPYTWYTISKSYGSNFFYLKPTNPVIANDSKYNYQIAIAPGTYSPTQLVAAINSSFQDVSNNAAADVNFNGQPLLTYNNNTSKTTVNLNIQNTFNETYYSFTFTPWSTTQPPGNTIVRGRTIPSYLGFNNATYYLNTINSNQTVYLTSVLNSSGEQAANYSIDASNNFFEVIQYIGSKSSRGYDGTQTQLFSTKVTLLDPDNNNAPVINTAVTRSQIITYIQTGLKASGYFDTLTNIYQQDITSNQQQNTGYSYFQFRIILDRTKVKYVPNAKIYIKFPDEPTTRQNIYNQLFSVWRYQQFALFNCFFFDNSGNEFSHITAETPFTNSNYIADTNTNIVFRCNTPGYTGGLNDASFNIPPGTYSDTGFANQVTNAISVNNSKYGNIFITQNTYAYINTKFNLQVDMLKTFTHDDYYITVGPTSILRSSKHGNSNYDASFNGTYTLASIPLTGNISNQPGGYIVDSSYILTVSPNPNSSNRNAPSVDVFLFANGEPVSPTNEATYYSLSGPGSFTSAIQAAIRNTVVSNPDINDEQNPFTNSTFTASTTLNTDGRYDLTLNMNINYSLTQFNYDISFNQGVNKPWTDLKLSNIYNLYDSSSNGGAYSLVISNSILDSQSIQITDANNTFTIASENAPADTFTIKIPPATYITDTLYQAINAQFSQNPKTYGSYITSYTDVSTGLNYSQIWMNINKIFTTADYMLSFWDPVSFISCYSGSSSVQNTTWDTTVGWILGFRDYTQYFLTKENLTANRNFPSITYYSSSINGSYTYDLQTENGLVISAAVTLTGDTTLSTNLFNYFLISLDDYIQNHLNDGLVTITRSQTSIQIPGYQYTTTQTCDPATNVLITTATAQQDSNNTTNLQLYALNQSVESQQPTIQQYSPGPFIKDLFGIIPVKPPSNAGDTYTEFGGSLQNQTRVYFGPVNIRKMSIQLLTDRGDLVDLNGSNWTFSFVCEQLYRSSSAAT